MDRVLRIIKKYIPRRLFRSLQPAYHYALALLGALIYRFPSRHITVVAITGTKGKSSTVEILNAILEAGGKRTAVAGTIRFKIGSKSKANLYKMTMPGRFFVQKFLRQAVNAGCEYAIVEMTSEAAKQYRHAFIAFNALIFLNLSPEHIESHGGYDNYLKAKLRLAKAVETSNKKHRVIVANADDVESEKFLSVDVDEKLAFTLTDARGYELSEEGTSFIWSGVPIHSHLKGLFNIYNILAAATYAKSVGIDASTIAHAMEHLREIPGRVQHINVGQNFEVIVDYAHTADSLTKLYETFPNKRKICVLGNTGGGRDMWKRPEMGKVADTFCDEIILTNEDPYDENPKKIIHDMVVGITSHIPNIIMDRREAIRAALSKAQAGDVVLITGKGTDPYIMEADGKRTPWSDAQVAKEELEKLR